MWYIVDNRQSLHFTQVFRCARKGLIIPEDTKICHLCFGTMNGKDGKPYKTRDGEVMKLKDFYNTVYEAVYERVKESSFSHEADKENIANKITLAAIKFGDLINHRTKNYIFDIEKFTASEGKTGTFLLYTIARINSILKKAGNEPINKNSQTVYSDSERELILTLSLQNEAFELAYNEKAPNIICENAYKIASDFSKFYSENHIIGEKDLLKRASWLKLCKATKKILENYLYILGIEPVEIM
ncbi:MAG: arginine--tRNA ligase [Clostridia bacterium]|nr:arginine--tRNA ligase [Clostridia bacterium]